MCCAADFNEAADYTVLKNIDDDSNRRALKDISSAGGILVK
jgi:hypothetical protein